MNKPRVTPKDTLTDTPAMQLDPQNPWPGLEAFTESSRRYFHGRDAEIDELARRVAGAPLTVLLGKSGLGKSSLLMAGLLPRLRAQHFLPVYLRLDHGEPVPPYIVQMADALQAAVRTAEVDSPPPQPGESLWAYLHRDGVEFWTRDNHPCLPVFVLDQFEEVYTLGARQPARVNEFRIALGDLAENRIPAELAQALAAGGGIQGGDSGSDDSRSDESGNDSRRDGDSYSDSDKAAPTTSLRLRSQRCKLLISLREDFLPELEAWRVALPSLGRVRLRLGPLRPAQALSAVHGAAPALMDEALGRRIVAFVAAAQAQEVVGAAEPGVFAAPTVLDAEAHPVDVSEPHPQQSPQAEVEPALLSLFCHGLNRRRLAQGKARFDDALLEGAQQGILADFYRDCFEGMPDSVPRWVADALITERGFRNSVAREDSTPERLSEAQLSRLIDRRLLRMEERHGTQRIELTHDLLTRVVRQERERLRAEDRARAEAATLLAANAEREALRAAEQQASQSAERERRLAEEARSGRIFKSLAGGLAVALAGAGVAVVVAWRQSEAAAQSAAEARESSERAQQSSALAQAQSVKAEANLRLAEERLQRIRDGIALKQAVLSGDRSRIAAFLRTNSTREWVQFAARAVPAGYRNPQGQEVFRYVLSPSAGALPRFRERAAVVTYRMDHSSFHNALLATGADRDFNASYVGWGYLSSVVALVEYVDPEQPAEVREFDMCALINR